MLLNRHIRRLVQLLDSTDVDLRIGAGEAIALIYEGARQFDEDFGFDVSTEEEEAEDNGIQERNAASRQTREMDDLCSKLCSKTVNNNDLVSVTSCVLSKYDNQSNNDLLV